MEYSAGILNVHVQYAYIFIAWYRSLTTFIDLTIFYHAHRPGFELQPLPGGKLPPQSDTTGL